MKNAAAAALIIISLIVASHVSQTAALNVSWSTASRITNDNFYDSRPALIPMSDGSLLLAYSSTRAPNVVDLYSRIYRSATGWSQEYQLTNGPGQNVAPSIVQMRNGTVLIAWASTRSGIVDVYLAQTDGTRIWGTSLVVGNTTYEDTLPTITVQKYGTIWLFWIRIISGSDLIYYKSNSGNTWSNEAVLVSSGLNLDPDAYVTKDDKVWVAWQRQNSGADWEIYATSYNGQWASSWIRITQNSATDDDPGITQDRDGNIWILWSREYPITGQTYQDELMSTYSSDSGATFPSSRETRITNDPNGQEKDDREPATAQGFDKTLWMVYKSDPENSTTGNMPFDIWSMKSSVISAHSIAVGAIVPETSAAGQGRNVTVSVKVQNLGDYAETTTVRLYARLGAIEYFLGSGTVTMSGGVSGLIPFQFPTKTYPLGVYTFRATVTTVPGETTANLGDNELVDGSLNLTKAQDVDHDGDIDIDDLTLVFTHQFTSDLNYDVNFDGVVDLSDLISVYLKMFS